MTAPRTSTGIAALDDLGRRLDAVVEPPRLRRLRPRRWAALALGLLAAAATPAIAAVVFDAPGRLEETHRDAAAAIVPDDPAATGRALAQLGYHVRWMLITDNPNRAHDGESPTRQRAVDAPPDGTKVLSILSKDGSLPVDPDARVLQIEISPAGSEILKSHDK
jgi:hypothetical protein